MKTLTTAFTAMLLSASVAFASSPALVLDAGTNPAYFASTVGVATSEVAPMSGAQLAANEVGN